MRNLDLTIECKDGYTPQIDTNKDMYLKEESKNKPRYDSS